MLQLGHLFSESCLKFLKEDVLDVPPMYEPIIRHLIKALMN